MAQANAIHAHRMARAKFVQDPVAQPDPSDWTLEDLGGVASSLRELVVYVDALHARHVQDERWFAEGSAAADDTSVPAHAGHIDDLLGKVAMLMGAAVEHADVLSDWGTGAAAAAVVPIYAPISVARSAIEAFSQVAWLCEPGLSSVERVARGLSARRLDIQGQLGLGNDDAVHERLRRVDDAAEALGLSKVRGHTPVSFLVRMPGRGGLVGRLLAGGAYKLLSAASHNEFWALTQLGYRVQEGLPAPPGSVMMMKEPPALALVFPLHLTLEALAGAAQLEIRYRGWEALEAEAFIRDIRAHKWDARRRRLGHL